jgi:hypothetical protein
MEASSKQYIKEVTDDYELFYERTGFIYDYQELESLGFEMFSFAGNFLPSSVPGLMTFCKKNPNYHIITTTDPGRYENCYVPGKRSYHLGNGDKNQNLVLNLCLHKSPELFAEETLAQAFAIFPDIYGGNERK